MIDYKRLPDRFWKENLPSDIYEVCRKHGTEQAGTGEYNAFYLAGIYYCACCGGDYPLYSSEAKFDSGTGWPSFWAPICKENVTFHEDKRGFDWLLGSRIEVRCARCDAHLGHVFNDGPKEHTGKRYCMNSIALIFYPKGVIAKNTLFNEDKT